jgi:hypothetical protein
MSNIDIKEMRAYLGRSISSINANKANGMLAEIRLRHTLIDLGFGDRISQGGWIARNVGVNVFGHHTCVLFPMTIEPEYSYTPGRVLEEPPLRLHTICSTMHQIGVHSYYCVPSIETENDCNSIIWHVKQLGIPVPPAYTLLEETIPHFSTRNRKHSFLRYHTNSDIIPENSVPEEFTKEHLRISFQNKYMSEMSDVDGIFWGQQFTYPLEIKEKTVAPDVSNKIGNYFGLDVGPFVKLAFYASKKGNLHSLFIVREIDNVQDRNLINWWFITFDILAQFASWIPQGGGMNMQGGGSTVVKIPKSQFKELNAANLSLL